MMQGNGPVRLYSVQHGVDWRPRWSSGASSCHEIAYVVATQSFTLTIHSVPILRPLEMVQTMFLLQLEMLCSHSF